MGSCAAPSAKGDDKFITTDYLQQCLSKSVELHDKVIGHYLNIKLSISWSHYQTGIIYSLRRE
ncbi:IS1 family transposase [Klebsiella pneumoniae]|uniref:IS1 family transposase n=1 Tax=Klebsiella pneumoniae TaxID=573 RepID=UPI00388E0434